MKKNYRMKKGLLVVIISIIIIAVDFAVVSFLSGCFTLNGQQTVTLEVYQEYEELGADASFSEVTVESNVDNSTIGSYEVVYRWLCFSKVRTVEVVDTTNPTISLEGSDQETIRIDSEYSDTGATASDNYDGDLTGSIVVSGLDDVDTSVAGQYTVTYSVSDSSGNTTSVDKLITVIDQDIEYQRDVTNTAGLDEDALEVILSWYNRYYQSMKDLKLVETKDLFSESYSDYGYMSDKAIQLLIDCRLESNHSLTLSDCYYDLTISKVSTSSNGNLTVTVVEDSYQNFSFLDGITSTLMNLEATFTLTLEDGEYRITTFDKEENFVQIFSADYSRTDDYQTYFDDAYTAYMEAYIAQNDEYKETLELLNSGEVTYESVVTVSADNEYDREAAVEYAQTYALTRNSKYWDISGSNCQNFVSQCLAAGGIPMDYSGSYQWKYYSAAVNTKNEQKGYSRSFLSVVYFRRYLTSKDSAGMVAEMDLSMYYAEIGDLIYFKSTGSNYTHAVIATSVITDDDGNVIDILCNGNTTDMANYPITASTYIYRDTIKIVGYN